MAQPGDIVVAESGLKWVVLELIGNAYGGQDARLIRPSSDGRYTALLKGTSGLIVIESPSFQPGDAVTIDGLKGTYMSREADGDVARVMLAPRRRQSPSGGFIQIEAGVARASLGLLVLENRKVV
jgi:hypothetical protein